MTITSNIAPEKLIDKNYLLEVNPYPSGYYIYLGILFALILGFGIYFSFRKFKKIYQKLYKKISSLLLTIAIIGLFLIFCRYEQIPYLGSRLMLVILIIVFVVWGLTICWYKYMNLPKEINEYKEKEKFNKYLP